MEKGSRAPKVRKALFLTLNCDLWGTRFSAFSRKSLAKSFHQGKRKIPHFIIGNGLDPNYFSSGYRVARAHNNLGVKYHFSLRQITFSRHTKNEFFVTVNISVDRREILKKERHRTAEHVRRTVCILFLSLFFLSGVLLVRANACICEP